MSKLNFKSKSVCNIFDLGSQRGAYLLILQLPQLQFSYMAFDFNCKLLLSVLIEFGRLCSADAFSTKNWTNR